jgi:hypothetical protein
MDHSAQEMVGVADDLVAALAFDMGNETDAAAVVFEIRVIEPRGTGPRGTTVW